MREMLSNSDFPTPLSDYLREARSGRWAAVSTVLVLVDTYTLTLSHMMEKYLHGPIVSTSSASPIMYLRPYLPYPSSAAPSIRYTTMLASKVNTLDDSPFNAEREEVQRQHREHSDRHAAPPSIKVKKEQNVNAEPSSSEHPLHPTMSLHQRANVDEMLVGPSDTSLPEAAPHYEEAARGNSVLGACIEIELSSQGLEEEFPLFRSSVLGESVQEPQRGPSSEEKEQQPKRKTSERMSTTFDSVVGFGRKVKRRVSSLWSNNGDERKDSAWVHLANGEHTHAANRRVVKPVKPTTKAGENGHSRWGSMRGSGSQPHNPYPSVAGLLASGAEDIESRRTSSAWTYTSDVRSAADVLGCELSRQVTLNSVAEYTSITRIESLTRQPDRRSGSVASGYIDSRRDAVGGSKTPTDAKPQGTSMVESGYSLAHHLSTAMELGRFDSDKIARRFENCKAEQTTQNAQGKSVESQHVRDEDLEKAIEQQLGPAKEGSDPNEGKLKSPFAWRRGRRQSSQPPEPRPSISSVGQEEMPKRAFGVDFAQIAGVLGTSMRQVDTIM